MSPLDWCLIELWRDSGIPLHVALRGIDRIFEKEAGKGRPERMPRSLFYCHPAVMETFQEYSQSMVGATEEPLRGSRQTLSKQSVLHYLAQLESCVGQRTEEVYQRAAHRLAFLKSEVAEGDDYEQIDQDLAQIGTMILDSLRQGMESEELKELQAHVRKETKIYRRRLSKEMYARLEKTYLDRKLRELFRVPEFSLLQVGKES